MLLNINTTTSIFGFIRTIRWDIFRIVIFGILVGFIAQGKFLSDLNIPLPLIAIVGTAISLLVTFRTAQSYDRWWEARMVWGSIVNESRTLIRDLILFLPQGDKENLKLFVERQTVWCYALSEALRKQDFSYKVKDYIVKNNITDANKHNAILALHSDQLKKIAQKGAISEFKEVQVTNTLARLGDAMGKCERIKSTIFPMSYGKFIHLLIYLFAFLLPFSLDNNFVFIKSTLTIIIPLIFIVIEKTAILMQDPFENAPMDTPMTQISQTIEMNLYEMIDEPVAKVDTVQSNFYYVL